MVFLTKIRILKYIYSKDVLMDFIIMDLEWNNTYARKTKGFINEIIEIGAVKLDENLNFKDKFSCLIKPKI